MIRLSENACQFDQSFFSDERRPRRSYHTGIGLTPLLPHVYERGIRGGISSGRKRRDTETSSETRASRFPAIINNNSVSYDPVSQLFTVSGIRDGKGIAYYFEDLPSDIKAEIRKLRRAQPKE